MNTSGFPGRSHKNGCNLRYGTNHQSRRSGTALGRAFPGLTAGATDTLVPRPHLEAIGLRPKGQRTYQLADGSDLVMDVTVATLEVMGEHVGGTVLFGEPGTEPQLGATALLSAGIEVDPVNQRLKKLPSVRLKTVA